MYPIFTFICQFPLAFSKTVTLYLLLQRHTVCTSYFLQLHLAAIMQKTRPPPQVCVFSLCPSPSAVFCPAALLTHFLFFFVAKKRKKCLFLYNRYIYIFMHLYIDYFLYQESFVRYEPRDQYTPPTRSPLMFCSPARERTA